MRVRKKINILGIVSGRTFLLYISSLAKKYSISGWVKRGIGFVDLEAEGTLTNIIEFVCVIHDFSKQLTDCIEIRFSDVQLLNSVEFSLIEGDDDVFYQENSTSKDVVISH